MKLYDACQIIILSQSVHSVVKIGDTYLLHSDTYRDHKYKD